MAAGRASLPIGPHVVSARAHPGPTAIRVVELDRPLTDLPPEPASQYRAALLLVRWQGRPLGTVTVGLERDARSLAPESLAKAICRQLEPELREAGLELPSAFPGVGLGIAQKPAQPTAFQPPLTVVVPTCRRPGALRRC